MKCLLLFVTLVWPPYCYSQNAITEITAGNKSIQFEGRIDFTNNIAAIYWPGSSVKLRFTGNEIKATLKDERGDNYYNVLIDDSMYVLKLDTTKKTYTLASNLATEEHTVELFRRTGWTSGITWFYNFQIPSQSKILELPHKKRMIEFYGNSITVGAAVESYVYAPGDTTDTNNSLSYAYVTAKHYNARYSCIASSGIGLMVSWGSLI